MAWMRGRVSLYLSILLFFAACDGLVEEAFHKLAPATPNQIVLMYSSGEPESDLALSTLEEVETRVKESGVPGTHALNWLICDRNKANNAAEMEQKGLSNFPMIFISVEGQGMGKECIV